MKKLVKPQISDLKKIKSIADFQFGKGAGEILFFGDIEVERSRGTNRIRFIYKDKKRICSFRVRDGFLVPSLIGGEMLLKNEFGLKVVVNEDSEPFVRDGKTVFAKHVLDANPEIAIKDEVIIVNQNDDFLGIGTARITGNMMKEMNKGVAVSTRKGMIIEK
jgi:7-cyano-7-deazaguanine tRNA-ribosyltransferase